MIKYELYYQQPYEKVMAEGEPIGYTSRSVIIMQFNDSGAELKAREFLAADPIIINHVKYYRKGLKLIRYILEA